MTQKTLSVPDIHCGHCKQSIEGAVAGVDGVSTVEVALEQRTVDVEFDGSNGTFASIVGAIEDQGYEVAG